MNMPTSRTETLANDVIGLAIGLHNAVGPGFLESVYEEGLCRELSRADYRYERQAQLQVMFRGEPIGVGVADIIVEDRLVLELKTVRQLATVHRAQLYSYLRASGLRLGLLLNFNTRLLRDGIKRVVHSSDHS